MTTLADRHMTDGPTADTRKTADERRWDVAPRHRISTHINPRYSRFVGLMKLLLPLIALILVALLIAWPALQEKGDFNLSFSGMTVQGDSLTMMNARYLGMDKRNQPYMITADYATQDPGDKRRVTLDNLQADLTLAGGVWISLTSTKGVYHLADQTLELDEEINVYSDLGYELVAQSAFIDLKRGLALSDEPVRGQGPLGRMTAENFMIDNKTENLHFGGGVKMTLYPQGRE